MKSKNSSTAAIYVAAGVFTLTYSGMPSLIPYEVLPWFFVFSVLFILMVVRMATTVTIPIWQPIVGLVGVILFTWFTVWMGARVFRTAILIQGQKPTLATLFRYAFKS